MNLAPAEVAPPRAGEFVATVLGETVPANLTQPIPARTDNGEELLLRIDPTGEQVLMWSGIFGASRGEWLVARSDFLWPGTRVYVAGQRGADDPRNVTVFSVRIISLPDFERVARQDVPAFGQAWQSGQAAALLGQRNGSGISLLAQDGTVSQILESGQGALPVTAGAQGFVVPGADLPAGRNGFLYVRGDGKGLGIQAYPFHSVRGVAADEQGDLWWIESSQVGLAQWRLWQYDSRAGQIVLRVQASTSLLGQTGDRTVEPTLIAALPARAGVRSFVIDTANPGAGRQFTGLYRIELGADGSVESIRLVRENTYRGPIQISPDFSRFGHLAFDPQQPSLTAGFVRPANQMWLQELPADGIGARGRLAAQAETRFEFFAPKLAWRSPQELLLARSRFSPAGVFSLEIFGLTQVALGGADGPVTSSYLYPPGNVIRDFATCADGSVLLSVAPEGRSLRLESWDGGQRPQVLAQLPDQFDRVHLCWQRYAGNVRIRSR